MSLPEFNKICHDIKAGGKLKVLRFYLMGEPLSNPDLPEMIKTACQMGLAERTELTSNGVLLDKKKSQEIIGSGLDYLRISISSVDESRHKRITQSKIQVDNIYHNIEQFRRIRDEMGQQKPFLNVKMIDSQDEKENMKFCNMYEAIADEAIIEKPMNWNSQKNSDFIKNTYGKNNAIDPKQLYPYYKEVCPFPFYTLVVNVDGDVTACCVDWNKNTCVGNVFDAPLKSIWDGEKMRDFRRMHLLRKRKENRSCSDCQFLFTTPDNIDDLSIDKIEKK